MEQNNTIQGSVERVTYHNPENGFCVLRVILKNKRQIVTVIGNVTQVMAGEDIEASGVWSNNKEYGLQLKATSIRVAVPSSIEGIKKYLASGLIKGVGKHFATVLVSAFKERVFEVLDNAPEKVLELPGIGKKRTEQIIKAWGEQKVIRKIMVFLHSHGVGTARAVRIYKAYGDNTIDKLQQNPYALSLDVWGIGFKTADQLAQSLGIAHNSVIRAEAGVRHVLNQYSGEGNCAILPSELTEQAHKMLEIEPEVIEQAIANEVDNGNIVKDLIAEQEHLYLAPLYYAEQGVANNIKRLMSSDTNVALTNEQLLNMASQNATISFSPSQKKAIIMAIKHQVSIITGGPGVGKTTIVKNIINILTRLNKQITLCAPTGRAAKRLSETSGYTAKTIHRLLEYRPGAGAKYNQDNQIKTDFLIIDEVSMVDISLMNTLLKAIKSGCGVLFVGDIDQLPSVGPGCVLADLINSGVIPTVRLTEIFRQALTSKIITNAHRVNQGEFPYYTNKKEDDFFFIEELDAEKIILRIQSIIADKLPKLYGFNPKQDVQLLIPMNRGSLGTKNMNLVLQQCLNPPTGKSIASMGIEYRTGDKIIQLVNNYDKDVFNGDIGFIERINLEDDLVLIKFDDRIVEYERSDLDEIDLAYAISIHKSQGSEYPVVITPIVTQHYTLLERNLLYTGITRAKKMVILIGQKKALFMAIKRVNAEKRITSLNERLLG